MASASSIKSAGPTATLPTRPISLTLNPGRNLFWSAPSTSTKIEFSTTALLVQLKAVSSVRRGENRGKELRHQNVVRVMEHTAAAQTGSFKLEIPADLNTGDVAVVLLVQNTDSHAIAGAVRVEVVAR